MRGGRRQGGGGRLVVKLRVRRSGGRSSTQIQCQGPYSQFADFFKRMPARNAAPAPSSHSIRQICTACQSKVVRTVKIRPTRNAAAIQLSPITNDTSAPVGSPSRRLSVSTQRWTL